MNIIFYRYRSICEPDFIDAFKALGIDVLEDCDGMDPGLSVEQKINNLGNAIYDSRPLFVFSINYLPFIAILCERLHVIYVAMTVDCPVFEIFNTSIRSKYNRIFLFDNNQLKEIEKENPGCIYHLPLGAAVQRFENTLGTTSDFKYDISFVGSLYNEKDPMLNIKDLPDNIKSKIDVAIKAQFNSDVYGLKELETIVDDELIKVLKKKSTEFFPSDLSVHDISGYVALNNYLGPHITFLERVKLLNMIAESADTAVMHLFTKSNTESLSNRLKIHGGVNSMTQMPFVFRQSKINLNITTRSITSGLSQRIWDILGCKGFLITNYQPEINDYFEDGKHLVTYKSYDDLLEKIQYYLTHEDERQLVAQNGFELINSGGSVLNRVIEMLRIITG